jgi:hypothetical protein
MERLGRHSESGLAGRLVISAGPLPRAYPGMGQDLLPVLSLLAAPPAGPGLSPPVGPALLPGRRPAIRPGWACLPAGLAGRCPRPGLPGSFLPRWASRLPRPGWALSRLSRLGYLAGHSRAAIPPPARRLGRIRRSGLAGISSPSPIC